MTYPRRSGFRALVLTVVVAAVAAVMAVSSAGPAHAATYRYWGYYQLTDGAWTFAQKGPAETNPADGSVEGWRWAVTEESGTPPRTPRVVPAFEQVCGGDAAPSGTKRVGVVIDYGRTVDADGTATPPAPTSACAVVAVAATGAEVLAAVASVRTGDAGLVCGVNGYPATGCGGAVADLTDEQRAADTSVTLAAGPTSAGAAPSGATPGATPLAPTETAGPLVSPVADSGTGSGVPVSVWVGLIVVLLGIAALGWTEMRRRREDA
jgi:hypothetical protein